jgi:nitrate/nitrite transport system ATP-binding protein
MPFLRVQGLKKSFRTGAREAQVLGGVQLSVDRGELVSIVGYSGSGKTTLVSLLAGLVEPDAGEIVLDGVRVSEPGPERGIVFQQYSLLPWMTVHENVALAVDAVHPRAPPAERRRITASFVELVNLTSSSWKRPGQLSGGMRQRVNVARALALEPKLLLMDEPFSALDALTRATLQDELLRIWTERRCTIVLVTNDVDEAILLSDRIYPLTPGPGAVLGPAIEVGLARPRERRHLSLTPDYQRARQDIVHFLRTSRRKPAAEVARETHADGRDLAAGEDLPGAWQPSGDHPGV